MDNFLKLVEEELVSARNQFAPLNSAHEAYAVIFEELDEFWQEVLKKRSQRDPANMLKELVQIAAMAARTAEDLGLIAPGSKLLAGAPELGPIADQTWQTIKEFWLVDAYAFTSIDSWLDANRIAQVGAAREKTASQLGWLILSAAVAYVTIEMGGYKEDDNWYQAHKPEILKLAEDKVQDAAYQWGSEEIWPNWIRKPKAQHEQEGVR